MKTNLEVILNDGGGGHPPQNMDSWNANKPGLKFFHPAPFSNKSQLAPDKKSVCFYNPLSNSRIKWNLYFLAGCVLNRATLFFITFFNFR